MNYTGNYIKQVTSFPNKIRTHWLNGLQGGRSTELLFQWLLIKTCLFSGQIFSSAQHQDSRKWRSISVASAVDR